MGWKGLVWWGAGEHVSLPSEGSHFSFLLIFLLLRGKNELSATRSTNFSREMGRSGL